MIYTIENSELKVEINSLGAELWSLFDKKSNTEHLWQGDEKIWSDRSPILFPICGRLKNAEYRLKDKTYSMQLHGFARKFEHALILQETDRIIFRLVENEETMRQYPFLFQLDTCFYLEGAKLHYTFEVTDTGSEELPFSIGFHTGYRVPFDASLTAKDYSIVFEKKETADQLLEAGLLTGETKRLLNDEQILPVRPDMFTQSYVLEGLQSEYVSIIENKSGREIRVTFHGFPYFLLWSVQQELPFICLEPWYGLPDTMDFKGSFLEKPALKILKPREVFTCSQMIEVL